MGRDTVPRGPETTHVWGPADAPDLSRMRRVLVVKLRYHGDVLLTTPVLSALKHAHPHLEIDALVYRETADMLSGHPALNELFCIDRELRRQGWLAQLAAEWRLIRALRRRHYDVLIHLTEHWRGPLLRRLLGIPCAVSARYTRRRNNRFWNSSFTHHYPVPKHPRHMVERHLDALRRLGVRPAREHSRLQLLPGEAAAASAAGKLAALGLSPQRYVLLHPGSRFFHKCWDPVRVAELVDRLHELGRVVVMTGAPTAAERAMAAGIVARCERAPVGLVGELSLKELAWCIEQAQLFVGVDSVPMHIAAAMGTPAVVLFGPSTQVVWGPWQAPHEIVSAGRSCQPCQQHGCGGGHVSECLMDITADQVLAAMARLEARTGQVRDESRTRGAGSFQEHGSSQWQSLKKI